jgi:hypothetical protein
VSFFLAPAAYHHLDVGIVPGLRQLREASVGDTASPHSLPLDAMRTKPVINGVYPLTDVMTELKTGKARHGDSLRIHFDDSVADTPE